MGDQGRRPDGSTWGDWGDDDELGRINLLTPEKVLQGVREVEAGLSFCLSLPLDFPGGTILNQTGRAIEIVAVFMVVYLSISLLTSLFMNWFNAKMALVTLVVIPQNGQGTPVRIRRGQTTPVWAGISGSRATPDTRAAEPSCRGPRLSSMR